MRFVLYGSIFAVFGVAVFLLSLPQTATISPLAAVNPAAAAATSTAPISPEVLPSVPEAPMPTSTPLPPIKNANDIGPQSPLSDPPTVMKGIYITAWTAGSPARMQALIDLVKRTELNTVVVDIKDYSGYVSYAMDVPGVIASGAEGQIRIARPNALIKELHDNGIYVIGRITDFQDPVLAKAHPEWALHDKTTGKVWTDKNGLAWMDPAAKPVWDYLISIANDAFNRGFDEVQFDYIRFASDGALGTISYPYWDQKTPRSTVIGNYFQYLRDNLPGRKISADLFGLSTYDTWDDLGIGQVIEDAYKYFDYVSPMVYPSHYAPGSLGYANPAQYPYEIIKYSMDHALDRLITLQVKTEKANSTIASAASGTEAVLDPQPVPEAKLRPWLQDFNLGATYTAAMVDEEIQATDDSLQNVSSTKAGYYGGWLLWNAGNTYTEAALQPKN